jgi:hypothetical protein
MVGGYVMLNLNILVNPQTTSDSTVKENKIKNPSN